MGADGTGESDDRLLSVTQVARYYGVGVATISGLVVDSTVASLDRGRLVAAGRFDIPLIRRSWADAIRVNSPGASRRIDPDQLMGPAARSAYDFHSAIDLKDSAAIYKLSSAATQAWGNQAAVVERWHDAVGDLMNSSTGVASGVYTLAPLEAVAVRIVYDAPKVPTVFTRPTPLKVATVLPLVEEDGAWKVDFALWEEQDRLQELLNQPLP